MNIMEKIEMEAKLKQNLAEWMIEHGAILYDKCQSNAYVYIIIERRKANRGKRPV